MSKRREIYLVLDNIRSAHNVGSIFRTADAAGVKKIFLCGFTPRPLSEGEPQVGGRAKMEKVSLGAEKTVPWEYHKQIGRLIRKLKQEVPILSSTKSKLQNLFQNFSLQDIPLRWLF